jgi:Family of unknown function (DUF6545)
MQTAGVRLLATAPITRRAERQRRQESLRLCTDLLRELPVRPRSMHELCDAVGALRGCRIRVQMERAVPAGLAALLARYEDEVVIHVSQLVSRLTRWRGMAHELAHFLLGHCEVMSADLRERLFPDLDPTLVDRVVALTPGYYPNDEEKHAEALGGRLLAIVLDGSIARPDGEPPEASRQDALFRQFWLLRPLWAELVTAMPDAALYRPGPALFDRIKVSDLDDRVARQVIEVGDVGRLLQASQDPAVRDRMATAASIAREHAHAARLSDIQIDATAEAAMLAAGARVVRGRDTRPRPGGVACAVSVAVHEELARLELVAAAFTRPIVRDTLVQCNL